MKEEKGKKHTDDPPEEGEKDQDQQEMSMSPLSQTLRLTQTLNITPRAERVQVQVSTDQVRNAPTEIKKTFFRSPFTGKKYHGTVSSLAQTLSLSKDYQYIFKEKKTSTRRKAHSHDKKSDVVKFLQSEDNSYTSPSKKDQTKNQQKYALCDTMRNLHRKYCSEHPQNTLSFATFCRARPSHIKLSHYLKRQVCL